MFKLITELSLHSLVSLVLTLNGLNCHHLLHIVFSILTDIALVIDIAAALMLPLYDWLRGSVEVFVATW